VVTPFERTAFARVAFSVRVPGASNVAVAVPSALVTWPPTPAPATGAPLEASVTVYVAGWPVETVLGPASWRIVSEPVTRANRIRSPGCTRNWHMPTEAKEPLTKNPQNVWSTE
jgi:hypothetical protein